MSTPQLENQVKSQAESITAAQIVRQRLKHYYPLLKQKSIRVLQQFTHHLRLLSIAQRAYLLSLLLLIMTSMDIFSGNVGIALAAILGIAAFMLDAWPAFERVWHKLYGKAFIIALYAVILNIVLAYAESTVNNMAGVKADTMRYTVNLVAMLLAPAWLFGATVVVMLGYMILHMLKIMLYLMLRPLGIRSRQLLDDEAYPKTFLTIRILLMPFVCIMMLMVVDSYITGYTDVTWHTTNSNQTQVLDESSNKLVLPRQLPDKTSPNQAIIPPTGSPIPTTMAENDVAKRSATEPLSETSSIGHLVAEDAMVYTSTWLSQRIALADQHGFHWYEVIAAQFLYHVESQGKSNCKITGDEHAIPVGDWDVLIITPKPEAALGFTFAVRPCQSPGQQWLFQQLTAVHPRS
jgi:hypothetical protein